MKKNRGILLTLLIIVIGISYIPIFINPSEYNFLDTSLSILGLFSLLGIWLWKKWGVYLQSTLYVWTFISAIAHLRWLQYDKDLAGAYPFFTLFMMVSILAPAVLLYIALRRKWSYFN